MTLLIVRPSSFFKQNKKNLSAVHTALGQHTHSKKNQNAGKAKNKRLLLDSTISNLLVVILIYDEKCLQPNCPSFLLS
jgi:endonuclease III-like uncharacterized protein